jgi:predicted alpha/beta-hydrolase family hydrolase
MPLKKRKAADPNDAPEPKRRVTRSASKVTAPAKEATNPKSEATAAKPSKTSKLAAKTASPNAEKTPKPSKKTKDPTSDPASAAKPAPGTLTIHDDSVKKPITCHRYPDPSEPTKATPALIFTHGAGGTLSAPAVVNFCTGYCKVHPTLAFRGSMNLNARVKGFHTCISHLSLEKESLVLGGRSMGARAAVIAGTEILAGDDGQRELSLVLVSYPLKGPKDIRDQILLDLPASVRVLFIVGEKDAMCPLGLLEKTRKKMAAKSRLVVVRGADHGMHVRPVEEEKRLGEEMGRLAATWVDGDVDDEDVHIGGEEEG